MASFYTLTTQAVGPGTLPGAGYYKPAATVTLTPVPASGSTFQSFSGDGVGEDVRTVVMNADASVTATFATPSDAQTIADALAQALVVQGDVNKLVTILSQPPTFTLGVTVTGSGTVSASPPSK